LLVDHTGKICLINKRAEILFAYSRDELVGKEIEVLIPTTLSRKHREVRDQFSKNPHARPMGIGQGLFAVDRNGRKFPVEISLSPYTEANQIFTIAIVRDVTQARYAERELRKRAREIERSNKDLEQFAMIASHDLQAPLQQLISYCHVLEEECGAALGEAGQGYAKIIITASERMQEQITGLLEYSRVGASDQKLASVDLAIVLERACANLEIEVERTKAKINISDDLPTLMGDSGNFTQIFQNLLSNAIKYHRPNQAPEISVEVSRDDQFWHFSVADNGIGILPDEFDNVFEIFHRSANHPENPGLGIGLAICKKIIERLEGRIWVDPGYQSGTKICFTLPARRMMD
jgi:PAS domain S-box-containing protein